ncbi:MAG: UDP-2,3-diacylglucosamine diphosphatase [Pseudomonadota bacterium]
MPGSLFISDLHLDASRPAVTRAFADFLQTHRDCDALYILGDLFESWIGDDDPAPLACDVRTLLHSFGDAGPAVYVMQGNRDFLLGETFCANTGASLLPDPTLISLDGVPTLLTHGDSLCTSDTDYQNYRKKVRSPAWQSELMTLSVEERQTLAVQLRRDSQEAKGRKPTDIMDVNADAVSIIMRGHGAQQMVHGHTHRPGRFEEPCGVRWVTGDWDHKGWWLEADSGELKLHSFII